MFKVNAKVIKKLDKFPDVQKALKQLEKTDVLVGIAQSNDARGGKSSGINNAQLLYVQTHGVRSQSMREEMQPTLDKGVPYSKAHQLYIQSHGSALWRVPPRPVLEPAIESRKKQIADALRQASQAALNGEDPAPYLHKAGTIGRDAAKGWFTNSDNGWPANAPSTIKEKGSDKPLIDTGQMRAAITFVLRNK